MVESGSNESSESTMFLPCYNATTLPDPGAPTAQVLALRPVEPARREQFSIVCEESNSGTSSGQGEADSRRVAADSREILVGKRSRVHVDGRALSPKCHVRSHQGNPLRRVRVSPRRQPGRGDGAAPAAGSGSANHFQAWNTMRPYWLLPAPRIL